MDGALGSVGTFHAHDGLLRAAREWLEVFEGLQIVPERHFDVDDSVVTIAVGRATGRGSVVEVEEITEVGDRVIATLHERYVGRTSGVEVERRCYMVFMKQDGG